MNFDLMSMLIGFHLSGFAMWLLVMFIGKSKDTKFLHLVYFVVTAMVWEIGIPITVLVSRIMRKNKEVKRDNMTIEERIKELNDELQKEELRYNNKVESVNRFFEHVEKDLGVKQNDHSKMFEALDEVHLRNKEKIIVKRTKLEEL